MRKPSPSALHFFSSPGSFAMPFCQCQPGWNGTDCTTSTAVITLAPIISAPCTTSSPPCGGTDHGLCDFNTNKCVCNTQDWVGTQCEIGMRNLSFELIVTHSFDCVAVCNGDVAVACSGNGVCNNGSMPHQCVCISYWTGTRCDQRKAEQNNLVKHY